MLAFLQSLSSAAAPSGTSAGLFDIAFWQQAVITLVAVVFGIPAGMFINRRVEEKRERKERLAVVTNNKLIVARVSPRDSSNRRLV